MAVDVHDQDRAQQTEEVRYKCRVEIKVAFPLQTMPKKKINDLIIYLYCYIEVAVLPHVETQQQSNKNAGNYNITQT